MHFSTENLMAIKNNYCGHSYIKQVEENRFKK